MPNFNGAETGIAVETSAKKQPSKLLDSSEYQGGSVSQTPESVSSLLKESPLIPEDEMVAEYKESQKQYIANLREQLIRGEITSDEFDERLAEGKTNDFRTLLETRRSANIDTLTGLLNRGAGETRIAQDLARIKRYGTGTTTIVGIDVDKFKNTNDSFGHQFGDIILRGVANALQHGVPRNTDIIVRAGGDEFWIEAYNSTAAEVMEHIIPRIQEYMTVVSELLNYHQTLTFGIAEYDPTSNIDPSTKAPQGDTVRELLRKADIALYAMKEAGRNGAIIFDLNNPKVKEVISKYDADEARNNLTQNATQQPQSAEDLIDPQKIRHIIAAKQAAAAHPDLASVQAPK